MYFVALRWLLSVCVVPHGVTDIFEFSVERVSLAYGLSLWWCVCVRSCAVQWLVAVASVVHFSRDVGGGLHALVAMGMLLSGMLGWHRAGKSIRSYAILCVYMLVVHLPRHYSQQSWSLWKGLSVIVLTCVCAAIDPVSKMHSSGEIWRRVGAGMIVGHVLLHLE